MASTIQIKRGTGSAVPSGLADGELAINLDNGRLYFGSGSTSVNSFRFTNLTADNYIVSSSVTSYTFQTLSGSSDFGDDVADIHKRTGSLKITGSLQLNGSNVLTSVPVNVSGLKSLKVNASSQTGSLTVGPAARQIELRGGSTLTSTNPRILSSTGIIEVDDAIQMNSHPIYFHEGATNSYIGVDVFTPDNLRIYANQDLYLVPDDNLIISSSTSAKTISYNDFDLRGELTASGNISSSGTITGNSLVGTVGTAAQGTIDHDSLANFVANEHIDHSGVSVIAGTGLTGGGTIAANRTLNVIGGTGVTANANDIAIGQDVATTANVLFNNITATGNVSASGNLYADVSLNLGNTSILDYSPHSSLRLGYNNDTTFIKIGRTGVTTGGILLDTNVTASGNISASGHVQGDRIYAGPLILGASPSADKIRIGFDSGLNFLEYGKNATTSHLFVGPITASGHISASGTVLANSLYIKGYNTANSTGTALRLGYDSSLTTLSYGLNSDTSHFFYGAAITASGNISASGDIEVNQILFDNGNHIVGHHVNDGLQIRTQNAEPIVFKTNGNNIRASIASDGVVNIVGNLDLDGDVIGDGATDISGIDQITTSTLRATSTTDASISSTGHAFQAGATNSTNVIIDNNEIMARNNGAVSNLHVNPDGGITTFNNSVSGDQVIIGNGHITASGNISGSSTSTILTGGTISSRDNIFLGEGSFANHILHFGPSAGVKTYPVINANANYELQIQRGSLETPLMKFFMRQHSAEPDTVHISGSLKVKTGPTTGTGHLEVEGNVTASGEISASGTISGQAGLTQHSITGTTDGEAKGDIVKFGGTTSMTAGAIYHYKSDGTWELADADDNTKSDGLLGVALGAASDTNGVLLRGMVTLDHDPGAVGDPIYLTTTAGDASATAPSGNGNIVRIIGYCLHASNGQIWFNPDSTFVEVNA